MLDLKQMLPSKARQELVRLILTRMEQARLNFSGDPTYGYIEARSEFGGDLGSWINTQLQDCYDEAFRIYDKRHPKFLTSAGVQRQGKSTPC